MFGSFLVARGKLQPDQVREALAQQRASRPQIGELAVKRGKMSIADVDQVLEAQAGKAATRFGDLAVRMGVLDQEDLLDILLEQQDLQRPLGSILVEMGALTRDEIEGELQAYHSASMPERLEQVKAYRDRGPG